MNDFAKKCKKSHYEGISMDNCLISYNENVVYLSVMTFL